MLDQDFYSNLLHGLVDAPFRCDSTIGKVNILLQRRKNTLVGRAGT